MTVRRALRILSIGVLLVACLVWARTGAHRGWTQTTVPVTTLDEVTGIEAIRYEDRLVLGLDFLGSAVLLGGMLASASLLLRKKTLQH